MKKILFYLIFMFILCFPLNFYSQDTSTIKGADEPPTENIVESNNTFAFNFYKELPQGKNLFFSPLSIFWTFAMVYEGAGGETEKEFKDLFNFPSEKTIIRNFFNSLLPYFSNEKSSSTTIISNSMWLQTDYHFFDEYINILKNNYNAQTFYSDFRKNPEKERKRINNWIKEKTKGKIESIIPPNALNFLTRFVLVNAVYFKSLWETEFDKSLTYNDFFLTDKEKIPVKMMKHSQETVFPYYNNEDCQMIELPYKGGNFSMYIFLPAMNIKELEKKLNYSKFKEWEKNLRAKKIKVFLPVLHVQYFTELKKILENMGIKTAFNTKADFHNIDGSRKLYIQKAFHKAMIEIDEEGSKASASTAVSIGIKSAVIITPIFKVNKPFIFIIKDKRTDLIIFMGRVSEPEKR